MNDLNTNIPRIDNILCRLVGGPGILQNKLHYMEGYCATICLYDDYARLHDYKDSGVLNSRKEHLFLHQSEPDEKNQ